MPILDLGYRGWDGSKTLRFFRWMVVAAAGISLVWRGLWLRRLLIISFFPCVISAAGFFIYENSVRSNEPPRMLATVLGIRPAAPGFSRILVAPALGSLKHASGQMPHPAGEIRVSYRRSSGGLRASITLPPGTSTR